MSELRNGNILCGGVGSGKSRAAVAYYLRNEAPKDIYVITTAKKRDTLDWDEEFIKAKVSRYEGLSFHGQLHVDSWNNLGKYVHVKDAFFIFDEQRLVGSGAWTKHFLKIAKLNNWIMLSATPGDTWMDYIPVFIANGFYKNKTEFVQTHVIWRPFSKFPKVDRYVAVSRLVKNKNALLVKMPLDRHTTRHTHILETGYDQELLRKVLKERWHVYDERPLKTPAELYGVMRRVVNSHSSRSETLRGLIEKHPRLIVFYNFDYELEELRKLCQDPFTGPPNSTNGASKTTDTSTSRSTDVGITPSGASVATRSQTASATSSRRTSERSPMLQIESGSSSTSGLNSTTDSGSSSSTSSFTVAEWNGHKHQEVPTTDRWVYLVQYMAGAEGWNCITTDTVVFYSLTYSYKHWEQAYGRIDRMNTPYSDLNYYVLKSSSIIDNAIWKSLGEKKSFNESDLGLWENANDLK